MKYTSARAFRQALEDRLRGEYPRHQIPRIRKMIAFERFMARLGKHWILKGGYALQLRTQKARTTQDIDLLVQDISPDQIAETLLVEIHQDMKDYFEFFVERANLDINLGDVLRFQVTSRLAGRVFERFHIDIGMGDPISVVLHDGNRVVQSRNQRRRLGSYEAHDFSRALDSLES